MKKYYFAALTLVVFACNSRDEAKISRSMDKSNSPREKSETVQSAAFDREEQQSPQEISAKQAKILASSAEMMSSSAARPIADSLGQFIRTANLKFKTKNVVQSSFAIEDIVTENSGYIQHSKIQGEIQREELVRFSKDSAWKITQFVTVNHLTARVPVAKLDAALKGMRPLVTYLDHRIVDAQNIGFDLFYNQLKQSRIAAYSLKSEQFSSKDQAEMSDQVLQRQMESDDAQVDNMRQLDKIRFSTIDIYMYQNSEIRKEKVVFYGEMDSYNAPFGSAFLESLSDGWRVIQVLVLLLVKAWSILLILFAAWFIYKSRRTRE